MVSPTKEQRRYMPGIDGLRAIAVVGVVMYHLNLNWLPGGFLGVTVFFVLSGYLITDLLIDEWKKTGKLNYLKFMVRRLRRLAPAFITMLLMVSAWVTLTNHEAFSKLQTEWLPALFYLLNWWYIFYDYSYFEAFGSPSPLTHIWSLAIEEQFYLIWPFLLILIITLFKKQSSRVMVIFAGIFLSTLLMAILYIPGTDPTRVYYGTDTRAFSLFLGAALAFIWPSQKLSKTLPMPASFVLEALGGIGLTITIFMFYVTSQYDAFLYQGGMFLLSFFTMISVAAFAHPASRFGRWLSSKPIRWIGVRSYGIYLWHYPIIILTTPSINTDGVDLKRVLVQIAATLVLAAWSYRFIEAPIRAGKLTKAVWRNPVFYRKLAGLIVVFVLFIGAGTVFVSQTNLESAAAPAVAEPTTEMGSGNDLMNGPEVLPVTPTKEEGTKTEPKPKTITIIGDSLIHDVIPFFKKIYPEAIIDYRIGRQMSEVPEVVSQLNENGQLGEYIIIQTGTNGPFKKSDLISIIQGLGTKKVYLVNCRVPRPWESTVNTTIEEVVKSLPYTNLIDWYSTSAGHEEYFVKDGVHLSKLGGETYSNLLVEHLKDD
ncbi:acyltransferase family protein [Bacillus sp. MRMR6]|uniref:acyltransferase family protein n=1 Tax=Bacillus sp. MRMR6 TaxID=1928617 RepID=UPI00158B2CDF|nr:acyltransferase family protein [Bacillus sp. MRMR6]